MSIAPEKRDITALFSTGRPYYIDFYQRDYTWKKEPIKKLLEDLFYRFNIDYKPEYDVNPEIISSKYDWYYLNTYVTNNYNGKLFIVDGQQRFTSLTLILIKLFHLTKNYLELRNFSEFIADRIAGRTPTGREYWMGHNDRKFALEDLYTHDVSNWDSSTTSDLSIKNIYQNYIFISQVLSNQLPTSHKLHAFSYWFLQCVMLVQIDISQTKDVPMVFEVINDRGERLKPYEVLKGKLLGQIPKEEIDSYHDIWQEKVHRIQKINEDYVDDFFRTYFRSKYVETRAQYSDFDGEYHKTIYEPEWDSLIHLHQNLPGVKRFITSDFEYYSNLYIRVLTATQQVKSDLGPYLFYNDINGQDRQVLLALSACVPRDEKEREKVLLVSRLFDQHFSLLQLTGSYNSNDFTGSLIELNKLLRGKDLDEIGDIYKRQILLDISKAKDTQVSNPFDWNYFKDSGLLTLGDKFVRYFFARIEAFIASETNMVTEDFYNMARNTGTVYGYHIEHIVANNDENRSLFSDEELFRTERNRLGALLLLRGRDNEASNNETYQGKVKTYSGSLLWNQTLHPDLYHKKMAFLDFDKKYGLGCKSYTTFDSQAIDERQQILFKLIQLIWPWNDGP